MNTRGKDLLDLCKVNDILIANGRKRGDIFGKFTSHQYNGSAVNDYLLMPYDFEHKISQFTVGDYAPWLSDHCPIMTHMNLTNLKEDEGIKLKSKPKQVEPSFIMDLEAKNKFLNELKSERNVQIFKDLLENNDLTALNMGASIKTIIMENAANCNIKKEKPRKKTRSNLPHGSMVFAKMLKIRLKSMEMS